MSPRLTKPGMRSANLTGMIHPKTKESVAPLGYLKNGSPVWPVIGGSSDDPDDPAYTGEDDDNPDDEDEEDEEDEDDPKSRKKRPAKKTAKDDDEDDDEDEEDSRVHRASEQAKRYRLKLRAAETKVGELESRLQAIEDETKAPDEVAARTINDLKDKNESLNDALLTAHAQLAFFKTKVPGVTWVDAADAFALAERAGLFDDAIDESGNVDERELRRGLKDLAKRKPHLVVKLEDDPKARGRKSTKDEEDDEEEGDDDEPRSRRSGSTMNGRRKGTKGTANRAALAKKFPVLNQM